MEFQLYIFVISVWVIIQSVLPLLFGWHATSKLPFFSFPFTPANIFNNINSAEHYRKNKITVYGTADN